MSDIPITIVGNLVDAPDLRFTPSGAAVANFTIASTPRTFDKATSEWRDGETTFMRCTLWRQAAENAAASLKKGVEVLAIGRLTSRTYDAASGRKTVMEMQVDHLGPSLARATATVTRNDRGPASGWSKPSAAVVEEDPWAAEAPF